MCACVRACVRACVCACVRVVNGLIMCIHACTFMCAWVPAWLANESAYIIRKNGSVRNLCYNLEFRANSNHQICCMI